MTKKQMKRNEDLAKEIRQWMLDHEIWVDTYIYFNGKCYGTSDKSNKHFYYNDAEHLVEYDDDPSKYVEYYNKDTITMTFEGDLYDILNQYYGRYGYKLEEEFENIFKKYGYYYELGYAWSLAAYEL